eukprot:1514979-Amphidinium_carterae.1
MNRRLSTVEDHQKGMAKRITELENRVKNCETTPKRGTQRASSASAKSKASTPDSPLHSGQDDDLKLTM